MKAMVTLNRKEQKRLTVLSEKPSPSRASQCAGYSVSKKRMVIYDGYSDTISHWLPQSTNVADQR